MNSGFRREQGLNHGDFVVFMESVSDSPLKSQAMLTSGLKERPFSRRFKCDCPAVGARLETGVIIRVRSVRERLELVGIRATEVHVPIPFDAGGAELVAVGADQPGDILTGGQSPVDADDVLVGTVPWSEARTLTAGSVYGRRDEEARPRRLSHEEGESGHKDNREFHGGNPVAWATKLDCGNCVGGV